MKVGFICEGPNDEAVFPHIIKKILGFEFESVFRQVDPESIKEFKKGEGYRQFNPFSAQDPSRTRFFNPANGRKSAPDNAFRCRSRPLCLPKNEDSLIPTTRIRRRFPIHAGSGFKGYVKMLSKRDCSLVVVIRDNDGAPRGKKIEALRNQINMVVENLEIQTLFAYGIAVEAMEA